MKTTFSTPMTQTSEESFAPPHPDHVRFFRVLELMTQPWIKLMYDTCSPVLDPAETGIVAVDSSFPHEVLVGPGESKVWLGRIGRSSLEWKVELWQAGRVVARMSTVISRLSADRTSSEALTPEMRELLEPLLEPATSAP